MRCATIDIGYNAIRAVVYENNKLGAPEIFNNKFKSDLHTLLSNDSLDVKHHTYLSIQYLLHVFKNLNVTSIKCVATAVLREHPRAQDFIDYIKKQYDFKVEILSGEDEAKLTTLGLIKGIQNGNGVAADLGGGSLELAEINDNKLGKLGSLQLGTKVISSLNIQEEDEIAEIIKNEFGGKQYDNLYLIGGALRFIGRFYIDFMHYPIKNLHNLEIETETFLYYLSKIQSAKKTAENKARIINNNAIYVAKAMINTFSPKKMIISTYGLKEGVRFQSLSAAEQKKDLVEEKVRYACDYTGGSTNFDEYHGIIASLLPEDESLKYILKLAIILNSLKNRFDKTLPPKAIAEYILSSEIPFTHRDRIMLALILCYTSNYKPDHEIIKISKKMISKTNHLTSQIIGHFLRIAEEIDGPIFTSPSFSFYKREHFLEVKTKDILPRPVFEKVCIRLKAIAYAQKNMSESK